MKTNKNFSARKKTCIKGAKNHGKLKINILENFKQIIILKRILQSSKETIFFKSSPFLVRLALLA